VEGQLMVRPARKRASHFMCGTMLWGVIAAGACAYLSQLSYSHVQSGEFDWPHDAWTIATYAVWILLMAGLTLEVQCWRERALFVLVLSNFAMGFVLAVWSRATLNDVRNLRIASAIVWGLAALASLSTVFHSPTAETSS
jgi:hypothetical protein